MKHWRNAPASTDRIDGTKVTETRERRTQLIAVIDNDLPFCRALARLLQMLGYRTELFASVADFTKSAELSSVSCLLVDAELAETYGAEIAYKLPELFSRLPVVLMTSSKDHVRHKDLRPVAILRKPFSEAHLAVAIGKAFVR